MDSGKPWPSLAIHLVRQFHDGMQARVQNDVEFSEPFDVNNWVKQSCVMCYTTYFASRTTTDAFQDSDTGFPIRYRLEDKLFNLRR